MLFIKRVLILILLVSWPVSAFAQQAGSPADRLVVATRHVPPFAIKGDDGEWTGIAIDLVREIAVDLSNEPAPPIDLEFRELSLKDMLSAFERSDVDLAAAALTSGSPVARTSQSSRAPRDEQPFLEPHAGGLSGRTLAGASVEFVLGRR